MSGQPLICSGCQQEIGVGEHYIEDTASRFVGKEDDPVFDEIAAMVFGGHGGKIIYCEECTEPGGDYLFETNYGEEEA